VFRAIAPEVQTRIEVLSDVPGLVDFFFTSDPSMDEAAWQKVMTTETAMPMLDGALTAFADCDWNAASLHGVVETIGEVNGLKLGKAQAPIRVAVTGKTIGPPLFESLEILGRDEVLRRLSAAKHAAGQ
jgi:glutamyl-tRNA synthetase